MRWLILFALVASPVLAQDEPPGCARGDHACVIASLPNPTTAQEYERLIAALRLVPGRDADVETRMREYLARYPTARMAAQYRQFLLAHERLATP